MAFADGVRPPLHHSLILQVFFEVLHKYAPFKLQKNVHMNGFRGGVQQSKPQHFHLQLLILHDPMILNVYITTNIVLDICELLIALKIVIHQQTVVKF